MSLPAFVFTLGFNKFRVQSTGNDAFSVRKATLSVAPFKQSSAVDGIVSIDIEHFHGAVSQGGHLWDPVTSPGRYSGNGAMVANPNNGANVNTGYTTGSPRLDYQARFVKTGTHYLWIRGSGAHRGRMIPATRARMARRLRPPIVSWASP